MRSICKERIVRDGRQEIPVPPIEAGKEETGSTQRSS